MNNNRGNNRRRGRGNNRQSGGGQQLNRIDSRARAAGLSAHQVIEINSIAILKSAILAGMGATIRGLTRLAPRRLALMHGPTFEGDAAGALGALADDYDRRIAEAVAAARGTS